MAVTLEAIATPENFDETGYLAANPDVAEAVRKGQFKSGRQHFEGHGRRESRLVRFPRSIAEIQQEKLERNLGGIRENAYVRVVNGQVVLR